MRDKLIAVVSRSCAPAFIRKVPATLTSDVAAVETQPAFALSLKPRRHQRGACWSCTWK